MNNSNNELLLSFMLYFKKIIAKNYFPCVLFFLSWLIIILLYFPAHNAMLIDDGVNGIYDIKQQGFKGLLSSYHFDSFYHGYYLILNMLYAVFGLNSIGWFFFFSFIHALNTSLLYKTIHQISHANCTLYRSKEIAICAAMFFLLSPYSAENIIWAATTHYIVTMTVFLFSLQWLHSFLLNQSSAKGYFLFLFLNIFSLFTFELTFLFPVIYVLLFWLYAMNQSSQIRFGKFLLNIITPICISIFVYFIVLFISKGTFMPHDGKGAAMFPPFHEMISQLGRQVVKLFSFVHYADYPLREKVYTFCNHWMLILCLTVAVWASIFYWLKRKSNASFYIICFFVVCGLLLLLPFATRFFVFVFKYENLRYSYFASAFLYTAFVYFLFHVHKVIRIVVIGSYLILFIYFITQTVNDKKQSAVLYHRFIETFPNAVSGTTYLLNIPTFCNESYMFWDASRLPIALYCYRNLDVSTHLQQVMFYNSCSDKDTFDVKKINDSSWHFQLKTNGSWLMNGYLGASNYETADYNILLGEWCDYTIQFKRKLRANEAVFYFDGIHFVSVK